MVVQTLSTWSIPATSSGAVSIGTALRAAFAALRISNSSLQWAWLGWSPTAAVLAMLSAKTLRREQLTSVYSNKKKVKLCIRGTNQFSSWSMGIKVEPT